MEPRNPPMKPRNPPPCQTRKQVWNILRQCDFTSLQNLHNNNLACPFYTMFHTYDLTHPDAVHKFVDLCPDRCIGGQQFLRHQNTWVHLLAHQNLYRPFGGLVELFVHLFSHEKRKSQVLQARLQTAQDTILIKMVDLEESCWKAEDAQDDAAKAHLETEETRQEAAKALRGAAQARQEAEKAQRSAAQALQEADLAVKKSFENAQQVKRDARNSIEKTEKEAEEAIDKAEKEAKKAIDKAEKETEEAIEKAEKEAEEAIEKAEKEAEEAIEKAEKEALEALTTASNVLRVFQIAKQWLTALYNASNFSRKIDESKAGDSSQTILEYLESEYTALENHLFMRAEALNTSQSMSNVTDRSSMKETLEVAFLWEKSSLLDQAINFMVDIQKVQNQPETPPPGDN